MNAARRKELAKLADQIAGIKTELERILGDEEQARDNIPESLCEKYEKSDAACDAIQSTIDAMEEAETAIQDESLTA